MLQQAAKPGVAFDLFEGGYFFGLNRVFRRGQTRPLSSWLKFGLLLSIGWLPMLVLSASQHMAIGRGRPDSFLLDISLHIRYLIALPMILLLPAKIAGKLETLVNHFLNAQLVGDSERQRFLDNISSVMSLRNSPIANWAIVFVVYLTSALCNTSSFPMSLHPGARLQAKGVSTSRPQAGGFYGLASRSMSWRFTGFFTA
jgi:hypothetical protein